MSCNRLCCVTVGRLLQAEAGRGGQRRVASAAGQDRQAHGREARERDCARRPQPRPHPKQGRDDVTDRGTRCPAAGARARQDGLEVEVSDWLTGSLGGHWPAFHSEDLFHYVNPINASDWLS